MNNKTSVLIKLEFDRVGNTYEWVLDRNSSILDDQIQNMLYEMSRLIGDIWKGHNYTITSNYYDVN